MKHYNKMARQAGMTLIELTVVLLVLIGLAGLMIPYVGGFISKTHDSTGSDSLAELAKSMQQYQVQFQGYPDDMDSLYVTSGTVGIFDKMMDPDLFEVVTLASSTANSIPAEAFTMTGIGSVMDMNETAADSATFESNDGISRAIVDGGKLVAIKFDATDAVNGCAGNYMGCTDETYLSQQLGGVAIDSAVNTYVVFGIGSGSSMIGKTIHEAPVHFAKTGAMSADNKYNRILSVFEVQNDGMMDMSKRAKFVGTIMPMMMLEGKAGALSSHYESVD